MDKIKRNQDYNRDGLMPPPRSDTTSVLNGLGNGAMLAAMPVIAIEVGAEILKKPLEASFKRNLMFAGIFTTVVGSVVGAMAGLKEAHNLREYRNNVSDEIRKLRADVDAHAQGKAQQAL